MKPADYDRLRTAFLEVCELPPHEQIARIASLFAGEPVLRGELEQLLAQDHAPSALEQSAIAAGVRDRLVDALDQAHEDLIGRTIDSYTIRSRLADGGMSTVYVATRDIGRGAERVALKMLHARFATPRARERFQQEAEILRQLQHAGIATIERAGVTVIDGIERPYLAMALIDGTDIIRHAQLRKFDARKRLELLAYICTAVHHAHDHGVVHRDLKPSNILVNPGGQPKVLDFGIASVMDDPDLPRPQRDDSEFLIGTVAYMSPEHAQRDPTQIDVRSDVYSLGVIGYELLSGRLPYNLSGRPMDETLRIIRTKVAARLSEIDPNFAGGTESIVFKALSKDPAERYQSARAMAQDIRRLLRGESVDAPPVANVGSDPSRIRGKLLLMVSAAIALIMLVATIAVISSELNEARRQTEIERSAASIAQQKAGAAQQREQSIRIEAERMVAAIQMMAEQKAAEGNRRDAILLYNEILNALRLLRPDEDPEIQRVESILNDIRDDVSGR